MFYFILFFLEIAVIFLLSRKMSQILSKFLSINLLSFLFLPGVIIHELSHLLIAAILLVPVGNMEFTPKKGEAGLKLGSVEIAKTDPVRRSIIGFAPVFVGIALVLGLTYYLISFTSFWGVPLSGTTPESVLERFWTSQNDGVSHWIKASVSIAVFYLLFAISNTMFSSKRDMEGTVEILLTLLIIFAAAYILGFRPSFPFIEKILTKEFFEVVRKSTIFLLAPILIDLITLGTIKLFSSRSRTF